MTKASQRRGRQRASFRGQLRRNGWLEGPVFEAEVCCLMALWEQGEAYSVLPPPESLQPDDSPAPGVPNVSQDLESNLVMAASFTQDEETAPDAPGKRPHNLEQSNAYRCGRCSVLSCVYVCLGRLELILHLV